MAKLNQIIAISKGVKASAYSTLTTIHKLMQKAELFSGLSKTYQRLNEDSEELPPDQKKVELHVSGLITEVEVALRDLWHTTARLEWSNCLATASITVNGEVLLTDVPVTYLLFLEKQLTDLRTFVDKLPTLESTEDWQQDASTGIYKTASVQTHRTKKIQRALVLYSATPEHPAQTQLVTEDVLAGYWHTVKQSGAMTGVERAAFGIRVEAVLRAVKEAREAANSIEEVSVPPVAERLLSYLFGSRHS